MAGKVDIIVDAHTRKAESAINGFAASTTNRIKAMDLAIRSLPIVALATTLFKAVQGAGKFVSVGVEFNATIEQQTMAFKALLGTMDGAEKRIQSIVKFAANTPFELPEAVQANKVLQALTNGALAGEEGMRLVGDAAAAAGKEFSETAMWVGRLYSGLESGTSVGEATMRLLEMGLISGQTKRQLDELATSGAQGAKAMDIVRDTFGRTAGAMEDQSRTLNGLLSTAKDTIAQFAGSMLEVPFDLFKKGLERALIAVGALDDDLTRLNKKLKQTRKEILALILDLNAQGLISEDFAKRALKNANSGSDLTTLQKLLDFITKIHEQKTKTSEKAAQQTKEELQNTLQMAEVRNRLYRQEAEMELQALRSNFRLTSFERRESELELLRRKIQLYDDEIQRLTQIRDLQESPESRELVNQRIDRSIEDRDQVSGELAGMEAEPDPRSFRDQMEANFTALREQWGTFEQQVAQSFTGTIASAVDSISSGLANALVITGRWKEALASIPQMIGVQIVQSIIRMGLQWVATQVMMMLLGKSLMAAATAATLPLAAGTAAIWAGPATLAAIASGGSLPAAAPGMIATSIGMTKALSVTGFKKGGYTGDGDPNDVAGEVHRGEFVIHNQALRRFGVGFFESFNRLQMPLVTPRTGGGAAGGAGPVNVQAAQPQIIIVQSEAEALRALESQAGEARVMKMVDRRLMDMGVRG